MNLAVIAWLFATQGTGMIDLNVDASDAPRGLVRVSETVPASPGSFALRFPKWIPGNHRPSGPINDVIGFHVFGEGRELTWQRDPIDLFEIDVKVPDGMSQIVIKFTVGQQPDTTFSSTLARLQWNRVVFLPTGDIRVIRVHPTLTVPQGWTIQTALPVVSRLNRQEEFDTVSAERLVDSPVQFGAYAKTFDIGANHFLDVLTQEPGEIAVRPEIVNSVKNLVAETGAIFSSRHYRDYHFLATFSEHAGHAGLEHHESTEVGSSEKALTGDPGLWEIGSLFCHEMFHSWNGKYRRPAGLVTPDFAVPEQTELVWIYEGMTEYYGDVLAARAGFQSLPTALDAIASEVDGMNVRHGRTWRPVADTAVSASILREGNTWATDRRQQDYYSESVATWLEVDATIRKLTSDTKSLDDFCRLFAGGEGGQPVVRPYRLEDVIGFLNQVAPYDWGSLLHKRVYEVNAGPLIEAFAAAGWRPVYNDKPNAMDAVLPIYDANPSHMGDLGLEFDKNGSITDIALDSPADKGGLAPGMKVLAINSRTFSEDHLVAAVKDSKNSPMPIEFVVERDGKLSTLNVDYHGGIRNPHLERIPNTTDYLTEILTPRVKR